ncbi:hypothetical protein [Frankia nepalensis]|uniref:hypothetical protein n=1 Tax=Frankia nepalensis TaxID=1836974 RepID=UPI001EE4DC54|nr:hypothetical protein [Frankia nepalensis]
MTVGTERDDAARDRKVILAAATGLTPLVAAARPGENTDYLAHILYTTVRADAVDCLHTARGMWLDRIRAGLRALAAPSTMVAASAPAFG